MIEPTDEMVQAVVDAADDHLINLPAFAARAGLVAALALAARDYDASPKAPDVGLCCVGYAPCERRAGCGVVTDREGSC